MSFYQRVWDLAIRVITLANAGHLFHTPATCGWFDHQGKPIYDVGVRCTGCGKRYP